jgi:hypothetical protein
MKHQRWTGSGGLVMDADAVILREWHGFSPEQRSKRCRKLMEHSRWPKMTEPSLFLTFP